MLELTNEETAALLKSSSASSASSSGGPTPRKGPGRKPNVPNFSPAERLFMGVRGVLEGVRSVQGGMEENTDHELVSQPTVNNAMNGQVGKRKDESLEKGIELVMSASKTLGSGVLFRCLESLTESDIKDLRPMQKAQMAEKMSSVIQKIERKSKDEEDRARILYVIPGNQPQKNYDVIDV